MLNKSIGLAGGIVATVAYLAGYNHVVSACVLVLCGLYFYRRVLAG